MSGEIRTWERRDDETEEAYRAFRAYLAQPRGDRSLYQATIDVGLKPGQPSKKVKRKPNRRVENWSSDHDWRQRAADYDAWLDRQADEQLAAELSDDAEQWAKRRREIRELAYDKAGMLLESADALLEKATVMLNTPLHRTVETTGQDGTTIELHPNDNWKPRDAATLIRAATSATEAADRMRRLAADMATDRVGVDVEVDLNELSDEDIERLARGEIDPETKEGRRELLRIVEGGKA